MTTLFACFFRNLTALGNVLTNRFSPALRLASGYSSCFSLYIKKHLTFSKFQYTFPVKEVKTSWQMCQKNDKPTCLFRFFLFGSSGSYSAEKNKVVGLSQGDLKIYIESFMKPAAL